MMRDASGGGNLVWRRGSKGLRLWLRLVEMDADRWCVSSSTAPGMTARCRHNDLAPEMAGHDWPVRLHHGKDESRAGAEEKHPVGCLERAHHP